MGTSGIVGVERDPTKALKGSYSSVSSTGISILHHPLPQVVCFVRSIVDRGEGGRDPPVGVLPANERQGIVHPECIVMLFRI